MEDILGRPRKLTGEEQIEEHMREIQEMVAFLDYSFERAFTLKEKEYIMAYKEHVEAI